MLTDLWFRVRALARRGALEEELDEELREHLAHETRKYVDAGLSPSAAARRARLAMGGLEGVKEQCRDARGRCGLAGTGCSGDEHSLGAAG